MGLLKQLSVASLAFAFTLTMMLLFHHHINAFLGAIVLLFVPGLWVSDAFSLAYLSLCPSSLISSLLVPLTHRCDTETGPKAEKGLRVYSEQPPSLCAREWECAPSVRVESANGEGEATL